jgi:sigma-B regulation protein RsbU (phosphoserine phosphatase)
VASLNAPTPGRVLVVDDEDGLRRLFQQSLRRAGFDVVAESGGPAALQRLREDPSIRVVLLDLHMPEMDGWAFRQEQRADPQLRDVPTVIVTGAPIADVVGRELHAAEYLLKPVFPDHLVSVVSDYCEPVW